ncbi:MAG: sugar phosphate isomerase/epimerase [Acidobacteriaceae bacterium]
MHTRREFLTGAATGLATAAVAPLAFAERGWPPLGVQLYTVRNQVQSDLSGPLAAIRKIGYTTVETYAAQYKISAQDLRKAILDAGLKVPSGHFGYDGFDAKYDYAKELGLKYMVCSSVPESLGSSLDGFKRGAEQYNKWGEKAKTMGMQFAFHNHNSEFQTYGGATGIETLLKNTDPHLVQWQMDCYWVAQAGYSPVKMLHEYAGRITLLHLKDRKAGAKPSLQTGGTQYFTEIGNGTLDWKKILPLGRKEGVRYMFVEQDTTERPPLESLKISYDNLQKLMS